jgi:hypothetical protein
LEQLEDCLPTIPGKPVVQQFCPPPFPVDTKSKKDPQPPLYITFGKYMPKDKADKDKKKKKKAKKQGGKKDEKPPKPIAWAEPRPQAYPTTYDLLNKAEVE